ncbi:MAG: CPBP family glutamic-type intramembrane protease [Planctomycetia bacterium]|nr:CPBP family glutamic-type intramembrane protease [Planctomycetia bacterium]
MRGILPYLLYANDPAMLNSIGMAGLFLIFGLSLLLMTGRALFGGRRKGSGLFPSRPWRTVPWGLGDAILLLLLFILLPGLLYSILYCIPNESRPVFLRQASQEVVESAGQDATAVEALSDVADTESEGSDETVTSDETVARPAAPEPHPLTQLMVAEEAPVSRVFILTLCFVTAVIIAPLGEEFLFRVLLQGAVARFFGRRRSLGPALISIGLPALLFAVIHIRGADSRTATDTLVVSFCITILATLLVLLTAVLLLARDATRLDFGLGRWRDIPLDLLRGAVATLILFPTLIGTQLACSVLLPGYVTDPVPIFIFALMLGFLFWKTHRFAVVVGAHATLNLVGFLGTLMLSG